MATRKGGFSSSINPFGTGSIGSLSQYDIGADLADLEVYKVEVAWGNGLATDADYLTALNKALTATDPGTQRRETAQNKLDDAVYRIDRSKAETKGIDTLIAFDQAAIAKMQPDNLRYRGVKDSLDAELSQRRSRDYGKLVTDYNDGKTSTETLLAWVQSTLKTLDPAAPDFDNWTNVKGELDDRIVSEKDSKVYQDYQRNRIKPAEFLAYITSRRDGYNPTSPQYADWSRKLEDATQQVTDTEQGKKDSAFFNRYQEGKVSDATYLKYLRTRISNMKPDDPQLGEWKHRLTQATFSLAEDKLRFDAERAANGVGSTSVKGHWETKHTKASTSQQLVNGKWTTVHTPASSGKVWVPAHTVVSGSGIARANAARNKLIHFYTAYRRTLNPGSAEWRQITRSLDVLGRASGGGSGGGGSKAKGKTAANAGAAVGTGPALKSHGKLIDPKYTLSNILGLFSINPQGKKKDVAAAKKALATNSASLQNALNAGDAVWLFQDPRAPGALVSELDPQGNPTGRMVRGAVYLPVSSEAFSNLKSVEAANFLAASEVALARGDSADYFYNLRRSGESLDTARRTDAQYREQNWEDWYKATSKAVDRATASGDYGTAISLSMDLASRLASEAQNPYLDDTRRSRIDELGDKLAKNPLMPTTDFNGNVVEGAVNLSDLATGKVTLNPGWHHVLKSDNAGRPDWGPVYDDKQDGSWEATHVTVHTTLGNKVVTGETERRTAAVSPQVYVKTDEGWQVIDLPQGADEISYPDEHGRVVRAYSLDGKTWISPAPGMPAPTVEINARLTASKDDAGNVTLTDAVTGDTVFEQTARGWQPVAAYFDQNPTAIGWYGQANWNELRGEERAANTQARQDSLNALEMGGPGQHMTLATTSPSGAVNLVPAGWKPYVPVATYTAFGPTRATAERAAALGMVAGATSASAAAAAGIGQGAAAVAAASQGRVAGPMSAAAALAAYGLPSDTPGRYNGISLTPRSVNLPNLSPSKALPGLIPALKAVAAVAFKPKASVAPVTPPRLMPRAPITAAAAAAKAASAKAPTKTAAQATTDAAAAVKAAMAEAERRRQIAAREATGRGR